jgi:hypothetical protein
MNNATTFFASILTVSTLLAACNKKDSTPPTPRPPTPGDTTVTVTPPPTGTPTFTGFTPKKAFIGDTLVLTGTNLGTDPTALSVTFGSGVTGKVVTANKTQVTVIVPDELTDTLVKLQLKAGTTQLSTSSNFQLNRPVIESIYPALGFPDQLITITGKGFRHSRNFNQVTFGNTAIPGANMSAVEHTELQFHVPSDTKEGIYGIRVEVARMTVTAAGKFQVVIPAITSFSPTSGKANTLVTIKGTHLKDPTGAATSVTFSDFNTGLNSKGANIASLSDTMIQVYVPSFAKAGTLRINVLAGYGSVKTTTAFTYSN